MANVYVRSGASGANNGSSKTDAYTSAAAALNAKTAGDNFWVASDHAEATGAAVTLTSPGTISAPCTVMCVDFSGSTPPVSADLRTTGVIAVGAFAGQVTIGNGNTYWYGLTIKGGTGAHDWGILLNGIGYNYFKNCVLWKAGTNPAASGIELDGSSSNDGWGIVLDNTTLRFGHVNDSVRLGNRVIWKNTGTAVNVTDATPSDLINFSQYSSVLIDGVDFSGCASTNLFNTSIGGGEMELRNVGINAATAISVLGNLAGRELTVIRADSTSNNYRQERHTYFADLTTETTIVRTGGASDGVTPIAWKIVTGANTKWIRPFECLLQGIWNETTGSNVTVTVFGIWGGGAVPNNDEIWIEVRYMGSGITPVSTIDNSNSKADYLATAAGQATDTSTWGGSTTKFKMSVTLSSPQPAMKGPIHVIVKVAKASSTFYVDPKIVLS